MKAVVSFARPTRTPEWKVSAWSVLVLAERGTPDQSYFQGGGARSRAHVWTDPGHPLRESTSELGGIIYKLAALFRRKTPSKSLHPHRIVSFAFVSDLILAHLFNKHPIPLH
jgi:hypothetical protein